MVFYIIFIDLFLLLLLFVFFLLIRLERRRQLTPSLLWLLAVDAERPHEFGVGVRLAADGFSLLENGFRPVELIYELIFTLEIINCHDLVHS